MARLVNVDLADSSLGRVFFQIVGEGAGGERFARFSGAIVPGPERLADMENGEPLRDFEIS